MTLPGNIDFNSMKPEEFENYLPDLFASGNGKVSQDPRLQKFLGENPDCAALVRDLETIAETARSLFEPIDDPSDAVWSNIQTKLRQEPTFAASQDNEPDEDEVKEID
jgi:hypothetical protein